MRPLNNEKPLLIQPKLADKIGLSECIILSQLHYWLEINKENNVNFHDGNYWVFHTISQWEKQFPFWCEKTIRNTFKSLEKQNLIKTGNYNKHRYDRTKWYTILYDNIPEIENDSLSNSVKSQTITEHSTIPWNASGKSCHIYKAHIATTIQENKNITTKNGFHPHSFENKDIIEQFTAYYYKAYFLKTGRQHPNLKSDQLNRIYDCLNSFISEYDLEFSHLTKMADHFFIKNIQTDYNLNHFATEGILKNLFWEALYRE